MTNKWNFEKNQVEKNLKTQKILEKKNSRQLRGRGFPMPTKNLQKTIKKLSAAPGNFEKPSKNPPAAPSNLQKTLPGDSFMSFGT